MERNSAGRFVSKSSNGSRSKKASNAKNTRRQSNAKNTRPSASAIKVLEVTSPRQLRAAEQLLEAGAGSLVLIWSPTCPHCHTYLPLWSELTKMSNKQTNMISIRSDVYPESSLASKKSVSGVPTVLYVDSAGQIQEVEESRNMPVMKNIVKNGTPANVVPAPTEPVMEDLPDGDIAAVATSIPGTVTRPSELNILPGSISESLKEMVPPQPTGVQNGGNLSTLIQTAGPAALLLGAYAAFGRTRSSGLPPATRRRRVRFSRRRGRRA